MTQTAAIFLDAYRELNARKMFWITLVISALVVSVLLMVGLTEKNELRFMFWDMSFPMPPSFTLADLLKATFVSVGVAFWLTWAAAILALISTASIFPDFVSSGSIDLMLAKPVSRLRLFILKYISGLLFVALQVTAFSLAAFLIIGIRAESWELGLFIAVPIVVVFFSYLFCICALVGLVTRSTIAALLLTLLFWLLLFGLNMTDGILMMPRVANDIYVEKLEERLQTHRARENPDARIMESLESRLSDVRATAGTWRRWHDAIVLVKSALPKTEETTNLLKRWLIQSADLPEMDENEEAQLPFLSADMLAAGVRGSDVIERMDETYRTRSAVWVLGTSLVFELVILALAGFIFMRRDF